MCGVDIDEQTRCAHYATELDVIAIKFRCCDTYYPCYQCHEAVADHQPMVWAPADSHERAILCGVCGTKLTIRAYIDSGSVCPDCGGQFNPGCSKHYSLYFDPTLVNRVNLR